jgi:glycosyltransferase involved in cell wall biosynthesis
VDSSADNTRSIVSNKYLDVILIHLIEKTDPGTARNIGIQRAKGEIIAFIDSDCIADHNWLERIVSAHKSNQKIVGGGICNGNDKKDFVAWAGYIAEFREFLPERPQRVVNHIPTCNISYKKSVFTTYGVFQGEFYPQEDLVFNHQLSLNGEEILFDPAIKVYHHHRSSVKDYLAHQRKIGAVTSKVLKVIPLEGSFIVQHPAIGAFFFPFLPVVKFLRTIFAFLKYQPGTIIKRPFVLVLFTMGLVFWIIGFAKGSFAK